MRLRYLPALAALLTVAGCPAQPVTGPLPVWVRAGFHPADMAMPHVLGLRGGIIAILWAPRDPLHSPPLASRANKILWVSRLPLRPGSPLLIRAALDGSRRTARREVPGGPGPSHADLPAAGCWTLSLRWSGHRDQLRLRYAAG